MYECLYHYKATVTNVYDGDSITVILDYGFNLKRLEVKVRLWGIDTPEIRGEERPDGLVSQAWLREKLPEGTEVILKTHYDKTGKYGRILAEVFLDGVNLNDQLLAEGLAEPYMRD
jgi:micrococcal nuclease